jgi:hypothetical protein
VARKNLSRTVIEGGRSYYNSWSRRASHGVERATTREWLDRVAVDLDEADATAPPARKRVHKQFHDKLGPAYRWLASQTGRPWSKVYSDLCARFDTRTIAGRHIVFDHMLLSVTRHDDPNFNHRRDDLVIDAHGILRKTAGFGRSYKAIRAEVLEWAAGRVCAKTCRGWWWFRREPIGSPCHRIHCELQGQHFWVAELAYHGLRLTSAGAMKPKHVRYLERLPRQLGSRLVIPSPWG